MAILHTRHRTRIIGSHRGRLLLALIAVLSGAQCGGGGGGGTDAPTTPPAPTIAPVATVAVSPTSLQLEVGGRGTLSAATLSASGATLSGRLVTWSSSDASKVSVASDGSVTGVALGSATITASSEGKAGTASVIVVPPPVAAVTLQPTTAVLYPTQTVQLTATLKDGAGNTLSGRTVVWTSADTTKVRVSTSGLVTAIAAPGATVTAASEGRSATAAITVNAPPVIALSTASVPVSLTKGGVGTTVVVSVSNSGSGTLDNLAVGNITYGAGQPTGWLSATLDRTIAPASLTLTLGSTATALNAGTYSATLPLSSTATGIANSPQIVTVSLTVLAAPGTMTARTASSISIEAFEVFRINQVVELRGADGALVNFPVRVRADAARGSGRVLSGDTTTSVNGLATFSALRYTAPEGFGVQFSASGFTPVLATYAPLTSWAYLRPVLANAADSVVSTAATVDVYLQLFTFFASQPVGSARVDVVWDPALLTFVADSQIVASSVGTVTANATSVSLGSYAAAATSTTTFARLGNLIRLRFRVTGSAAHASVVLKNLDIRDTNGAALTTGQVDATLLLRIR